MHYRYDISQDLFTNVVASVESVVASYFSSAKSRLKSHAACYHCLYNRTDLLSQSLAWIELSRISDAFMRGESHVCCPKDLRSMIRLSSIAPDVCLSHLPIKDDITVLEELGRGAFGVIYKGKMNGRLVALKELHLKGETDLEEKRSKVRMIGSWIYYC